MKSDRPSHDRPSDEEFRAELEALDKVLRSPVEPSRPPIIPPGLGFESRRDLVPPPPDAGALRAKAAAPPLPPPRPRRSLARAAWVVALGGGFLASGYLGWLLTTSPIVDIAPEEQATRVPSKATPDVPRAVRPNALPRARRSASAANAAESNAAGAAPSEAARASTAAMPAEGRDLSPASSAAAPLRSESAKEASAPVLPPESRPLAIASRAGIPSTAIEPVPLMNAPVRSSPPMLPDAPAAVAAKAMAAVAADQAAIEATLRQYERAYDRLDAKAAVAVWPTVDQRALSRAFAGLASQELVFRGCEVVVRAGASTATASCRGTAEYVRKVGDPRVRVEPREWTFTLNKTEGEWRIDAVDGRR